MAWTYDPSLPSDKDRVRFLVGDTNDLDPIVDDGEINYLLTLYPDIHKAAATCCRGIAANLRRELTLNPAAGSLSIDPQVQADGFMKLAGELDSQSVIVGGTGMYGGGISKAVKRGVEQNSDRVPPAFTTSRHSDRSLVDERLSPVDE